METGSLSRVPCAEFICNRTNSHEVQSATEVWKNIHSSATSKAAIRSEMYGAHAFCSHGLPGVLHLSLSLCRPSVPAGLPLHITAEVQDALLRCVNMTVFSMLRSAASLCKSCVANRWHTSPASGDWKGLLRVWTRSDQMLIAVQFSTHTIFLC